MITLDELADLMIEIVPDARHIIEQQERKVSITTVYEKDGIEYQSRRFINNIDLESYRGDFRDILRYLFREFIS